MRVIVILGEKLPPVASATVESPVLKNRLEKALSIYSSTDAIMVCGGRVETRHPHTEAYVMARFLRERLPPDARVFKEVKSKTTVENARYAYAMLRRLDIRVSSIVLVTSAFHMRRAARIFDCSNADGYRIERVPSRNGIDGARLERRLARERRYYREFVERSNKCHQQDSPV